MYIIEEKKFGDHEEVAEALEENYFKKYFGSNQIIRNAARRFILNNNRSAALELNKAVTFFGDSIDAFEIIQKIEEKYEVEENSETESNKCSESSESLRYNDFPFYLGVSMFILIFTSLVAGFYN